MRGSVLPATKHARLHRMGPGQATSLVLELTQRNEVVALPRKKKDVLFHEIGEGLRPVIP